MAEKSTFLWKTKPLSIAESSRIMATEQQNRRLEFARLVLPFMLKQTFGRPIFPVNYSKTSGTVLMVRRNCNGRPIILHNQQDIDEWMRVIGKYERCGTAVFTRGFTTLFVELNPTEPIYIGIYDIDIAELELEREARKVVYKIVNLLFNKKKFKVLGLYTGSSWQVWFRRKNGKPLGSYEYVRDKLIKPIGRKAGAFIPTHQKRGHVTGKVSLDYSVNARRRPIRFPFSQHQKTGRVCIPVVDKPHYGNRIFLLKPKHDAHPEIVKRNLKKYQKMINNFLTPRLVENPIRSKSQWRFLASRHPKMFREWMQEYPVKYHELPEKIG